VKRLIYFIAALILYPASYGICELIYPSIKDIDYWNAVRFILFDVTIFLLCKVALLTDELPKEIKLGIYVLISMLFASILEKFLFLKSLGKDEFHGMDVLFIIASLILGYKKYFYAVDGKHNNTNK